VAEDAGQYTVVATSGSHTATHTVSVTPRDLDGEIEVVGRGRVSDVHTSDLWVWEAPADGRDYAITGTWGGDGEAFFWDVTDPANITPVDTVTVDARTVNDVKVSADGRTGRHRVYRAAHRRRPQPVHLRGPRLRPQQRPPLRDPQHRGPGQSRDCRPV